MIQGFDLGGVIFFKVCECVMQVFVFFGCLQINLALSKRGL